MAHSASHTNVSLAGHKKTYRRIEIEVAKKLKWLKLSQLTYETSDATSSPQQHQYELVQRTTHRGTASSSSSQRVGAVDICCILHKKKSATGDDGSNDDDAKQRITRRFLVLVSQYRPPIDAFTLEMPAGLTDSTDKSPVVTAGRELYEETGYVANTDVLRWIDSKKKKKSEEEEENTNAGEDTSPAASTFGPLSYDPGVADDLFELVQFNIEIDEDGKDAEAAPDEDTAEEERRLQHRLKAMNRHPVANNDEGEDTVTHLLALDGDAEGELSVVKRLEALRRSIHPRTVVDGKLQTLVLGMDMAQRL